MEDFSQAMGVVNAPADAGAPFQDESSNAGFGDMEVSAAPPPPGHEVEGTGLDMAATIGLGVKSPMALKIQQPHARLFDKIIKQLFKLQIKADAKEHLKDLSRSFLAAFLHHEQLGRSLAEKNFVKIIRYLVPTKATNFGDRLRKAGWEPPEGIEVRVELAPMKRQVQELCEGVSDIDKDGLKRLYSVVAHFQERLIRHVQSCANNESLKVLSLEWVRGKALLYISDEGFKPLVWLASPEIEEASKSFAIPVNPVCPVPQKFSSTEMIIPPLPRKLRSNAHLKLVDRTAKRILTTQISNEATDSLKSIVYNLFLNLMKHRITDINNMQDNLISVIGPAFSGPNAVSELTTFFQTFGLPFDSSTVQVDAEGKIVSNPSIVPTAAEPYKESDFEVGELDDGDVDAQSDIDMNEVKETSDTEKYAILSDGEDLKVVLLLSSCRRLLKDLAIAESPSQGKIYIETIFNFVFLFLCKLLRYVQSKAQEDNLDIVKLAWLKQKGLPAVGNEEFKPFLYLVGAEKTSHGVSSMIGNQASSNMQAPHGRVVDRVVKQIFKLQFKADAKEYLKDVVKAFMVSLLKVDLVGKNLGEKDIMKTIRNLVPTKSSQFGEKLRRSACEAPEGLDFKVENSQMKRQVEELSDNEIEPDKDGLKRFYSLVTHFSERLVSHIQHIANNEEVKVIALDWLRRTGLQSVIDEGFRPLLEMTLKVMTPSFMLSCQNFARTEKEFPDGSAKMSITGKSGALISEMDKQDEGFDGSDGLNKDKNKDGVPKMDDGRGLEDPSHKIKIQPPHARLVDRVLKMVFKLQLKADAKDFIKEVVKCFLIGFLKSESLGRSLSEKNILRAIRTMVPAKASNFGERLRKGCCEPPEGLDLKIEVAPMRRQVQELSDYLLDGDREGLKRLYALIAHFSERLVHHIQHTANNEEVKVIGLEWLKSKPLSFVADEGLKPLLEIAGIAIQNDEKVSHAIRSGIEENPAKRGLSEDGMEWNDPKRQKLDMVSGLNQPKDLTAEGLDTAVESMADHDDGNQSGDDGEGAANRAKMQHPHARLVDRMLRMIFKLQLKADAKEHIKELTKCFIIGFLRLEILEKSLSDRTMYRAIRMLVPAKASNFGERLRRAGCEQPEGFAFKLETPPMKVQVSELSEGTVDGDKDGLKRLYALVGHFCERLVSHVQHTANNEEVKVITLDWMRLKALSLVSDEGFKPLLRMAEVFFYHYPNGDYMRELKDVLGARSSLMLAGDDLLDADGKSKLDDEGKLDEGGLDDGMPGDPSSKTLPKAQMPHSKLVDKVIKQTFKLQLKADAKEQLKELTRSFMSGFLKHESLEKSLSEKNVLRAIRTLVPAKVSIFGDKLRKSCCDPPEGLDLKIEIAPMRRQIHELSDGAVDADKEGLKRWYAVAAYFCDRFVAHLQVCATNEDVKVVPAEYIQTRAYCSITDDALKALLEVAGVTVAYDERIVKKMLFITEEVEMKSSHVAGEWSDNKRRKVDSGQENLDSAVGGSFENLEPGSDFDNQASNEVTQGGGDAEAAGAGASGGGAEGEGGDGEGGDGEEGGEGKGKSTGSSKPLNPHARLVDKVVKIVFKLQLKAEAKELIKDMLRSFAAGFLRQETLGKSLSEKNVYRTFRHLIPIKSSCYGDRMRRSGCDIPDSLDIKVEVAPMKRFVQELTGGHMEPGKDGIRRLYAVMVNFIERLVRHVQNCANNDGVKVISMEWLRDKALLTILDDGMFPLISLMDPSTIPFLRVHPKNVPPYIRVGKGDDEPDGKKTADEEEKKREDDKEASSSEAV
ncbi:hypothetical protein GUITHDRAFT_110648 [Guillardia theta CCMP2712]|uniref:Uncharacterized protein n=1 Tax=Guillardia theta (strain CCMP2712) TaxID=905079 RepID=L1J3Y6_GUITC|nr:hypothetical protein GUITHDRAFT_110648 [Guillardia theta CCMP2712]EKX43231.1 hypothetical protein GUITHDRAFT_110648 [Guillardia theta CCMP2712]|eukprot:XP_005830211.1 hypothetical protein GUITHDRAFT_110648 [Guillardia theta CCMP2712]